MPPLPDNFISFNTFSSRFITQTAHDKVMHLSLFVDGEDNELKQKYVNAAAAHNNKIYQDPNFFDSGFDLFLPKNDNQNEVDTYGDGTRFFVPDRSNNGNSFINKVNFKIKCCGKIYTRDTTFFFSPFYTFMRSSMSKTPLRLANNQGIIDAGYRGPLIGMFDCIYHSCDPSKDADYYMDAYSRVLQICAPNLIPIYVQVVDTLEEVGPNTSRGDGGFGSTGV